MTDSVRAIQLTEAQLFELAEGPASLNINLFPLELSAGHVSMLAFDVQEAVNRQHRLGRTKLPGYIRGQQVAYHLGLAAFVRPDIATATACADYLQQSRVLPFSWLRGAELRSQIDLQS